MATESLSSTQAGEQLDRSPLGQQIAHRIRRDIFFARLPPGTRLKQQELCDRYGTSRMPVRDALHQLEHEGFIVTTPGGRAHVAEFSREDVEDIFYAEACLHGRAARRATQRVTDDDLHQLELFHEEMLAAADANDGTIIARSNWRFHECINRLAGSNRLLAAIRTVSLHVPRDFLAEVLDQQDVSNRQHAQALEAIRARDPDRVEAILHQHIMDACDKFLELRETRGALFASSE